MKTITKFILIMLATSAWNILNAQNPDRCGTMAHHQELMKNPEYAKGYEKAQQVTDEKIAANPGFKSAGVITIPVVVHILYSTAGQNIPDSRVIEQIDVLNLDFSGTNANVGNTPQYGPAWLPTRIFSFALRSRIPAATRLTALFTKQQLWDLGTRMITLSTTLQEVMMHGRQEAI